MLHAVYIYCLFLDGFVMSKFTVPDELISEPVS